MTGRGSAVWCEAESCVIIGAMQPVEGRAVFVRAALVLQHVGTDQLLKALRSDQGLVAGEPLSRSEWQALLDTREAAPLERTTLVNSDAALWLFRAGFTGIASARQQLEETDALLCSWHLGSVSACLVDERRASGLRDQWARESYRRAHDAAKAVRVDQALLAARQAFHLAIQMQAAHVGLLAALLTLGGDLARGQGYLQMAQNSCGAAFRKDAEDRKAGFMRELTLSAQPAIRGRDGEKEREYLNRYPGTTIRALRESWGQDSRGGSSRKVA